MLSIKPISNGASYHFYLQKEALGTWVGTGSEILGLPQQVEAKEFDAVRRGVHPETGEKLRILDPSDRIYHRNGKYKIHYAREMWDLTISAPKTVSVQEMVDPQIREAHRRTVAELQHRVEQNLGALVIAKYEHSVNRLGDPQIHTHLVAANLRFTGEDWRTLNANAIYRSQADVNEFYRKRLGEMLTNWGYHMQGHEVANVPYETARKFSQRSDQIKQQMKELGLNDATNREQHVIANRYRPAKPNVSHVEIREYQLSRLTAAEHSQLLRIRDEALERSEKQKVSGADQAHGERPNRMTSWEYGADSDMSVRISNRMRGY